MIYTSRFSIIQNIPMYITNIKRRGIVGSLRHYLIQLFFPIYSKYRKREQFIFDEETYETFASKYGATWSNERTIEIPIFKLYLERALSQNKKILEVGCVLNHFIENNGKWTVLDKYEIYDGVINEDIADYTTTVKYDLVLSISTMEHVGFDEAIVDSNKVIAAINNVANNLLSKQGRFIFSVPLGYNQDLDKKILSNKLGLDKCIFMKRVGASKWEQTDINDSKITQAMYGSPYEAANALAICFVESHQD